MFLALRLRQNRVVEDLHDGPVAVREFARRFLRPVDPLDEHDRTLGESLEALRSYSWDEDERVYFVNVESIRPEYR